MKVIMLLLQVVISMGLLNVWVVRQNQATPYRGGNAQTMREEFMIYGLPAWFSYFVGALKISIAVALLIGIWIPSLIQPAALTLFLLMLCAIAMHLKVNDPIKKSIPALLMLSMSILLLLAGRL